MKTILSRLPCLLLLLPTAAMAHTGASGTASFLHGLGHPFSGVDHLLAMVALGVWAAQCGGRARWVLPMAFVAMVLLGGLSGMAGMALPYIEQGILLSILLLGLLIAGACRLPLAASAMLAGLFAVFHGYAHGAEMPAAASAMTYTVGFVLATAVLHLCGLGLGMRLRRFARLDCNRAIGGAIAFGGLYLMFA